MTDRALDDLARRVMLDAARREYGSLMEEQPEHDFSPEFERKMRKLACRANHSIWHRAARAAACLFLAALLCGCAVLAVSAEARETLTGWVREVYETSFIYRFFGTPSETSAYVLYLPAYIPAGYQTREEHILKDVLSVEYINDTHNLTVFTCFLNGASPVLQIVRDGTETYQRVSVNGMPAELYLDRDEGEANVLIWTDEREGTIFCLHSALSETELIRIAESVEAVPATWHPAWLPEGYEVFDETPGTPAYNGYMSGGRLISLVVLDSIESAAVYVTVEEDDLQKQVLVSGLPADLYLGTEGRNSALIWTDDRVGLAFTLITDSEITEEEIIRIAESVRPALAPEQPHRPAWVPSEYVRFGKTGGYQKMELHYDKENGEQILFRYWADGYGGSLPDEMREDVNGLTPENVLVNGLEARLYAGAGGVRHLVWRGRESDGTYWITAPLTGGELIGIAQSVGSTQTSMTRYDEKLP